MPHHLYGIDRGTASRRRRSAGRSSDRSGVRFHRLYLFDLREDFPSRLRAGDRAGLERIIGATCQGRALGAVDLKGKGRMNPVC
jgi:hypothetical protein